MVEGIVTERDLPPVAVDSMPKKLNARGARGAKVASVKKRRRVGVGEVVGRAPLQPIHARDLLCRLGVKKRTLASFAPFAPLAFNFFRLRIRTTGRMA
jgi:hypothetical protein